MGERTAAPDSYGPATDEQIAAFEAGDEPWESWSDGIDALIARVRQEQERRQNAEAACADASDHSAMTGMRLRDAEAEVARLRAEVDRMRPVVWAAEHYEEITDVADATLLMGASRRLARAVRAYREGEA